MKNEPNVQQNQQTTTEEDNVLFTSILGSIVTLLVTVFVSLHKRNNNTTSTTSRNSNCPFQCYTVLQNVIQHLSELNRQYRDCEKPQKRNRYNGREEDIGMDFEIISKSDLEVLQPNNMIDNALIYSEVDNTQTAITSDHNGRFQMFKDPETIEILKQDINLEGIILTTAIGIDKGTQTSSYKVISKETFNYIEGDHSKEIDYNDIMNQGRLLQFIPEEHDGNVIKHKDKEIQSKPETCCVCVQNNEENSYLCLPPVPSTWSKVKKRDSFQDEGSYQVLTPIDEISQSSSTCICDTIAMLADYEQDDKKRDRYTGSHQRATSTKLYKPGTRFAEVTPINPYAVDKVHGHFDVCPAKYSNNQNPVTQVRPRPLPTDFKYTQVIKMKQADELRSRNKCVRIKKSSAYCTNPYCKSTCNKNSTSR